MKTVDKILKLKNSDEIETLLKNTDSSVIINEIISLDDKQKELVLKKLSDVMESNYFEMLLLAIKSTR